GSRWRFTATCSQTGTQMPRSCATTRRAPTSCANGRNPGPSTRPRRLQAWSRPRCCEWQNCTRTPRRRSFGAAGGLSGTALAVLALPAVGGKFGVRGGGYSMSNSASWNIDRTWIGTPEPDTRVVNMNHLGRALTEYNDPPVNVLFVYNSNPAATVPDQRRIVRGLERDDLFTVVFEQVMTDTALYADVVLPATTFLEGYDFAKAYGPITLDLGKAVVEPGGEARSNADVFGELCERLGLLSDTEPAGELDLMLDVLNRLPPAIGEPLRAGELPTPSFGAGPVQVGDW